MPDNGVTLMGSKITGRIPQTTPTSQCIYTKITDKFISNSIKALYVKIKIIFQAIQVCFQGVYILLFSVGLFIRF